MTLATRSKTGTGPLRSPFPRALSSVQKSVITGRKRPTRQSLYRTTSSREAVSNPCGSSLSTRMVRSRERRVLAGAGVHESLGKHMVSHEIRNVAAEHRSYCEPHVHDCDEINILLSDSYLSYEIRLGDEVFVVNAPATIHIPAGVVHSANVIEGSGLYRDGRYP